MTDTSRPDLLDAVERERKRASVRSLDISFNELTDMHTQGELHITPAYQRTFRWSVEKQSQFIESVILEMPLPPIYAVEVGPARWELIDGLQRLSTYLHFRGSLQLPDRGIELGDKLTLAGCDIVTALNNCKYEDLPTALQHRVRRCHLRVEIVRQESNPRFSFYMFKRLNTGGEPLSDMEARNCSIRLLGPSFCDFISRLTDDENFQLCTGNMTEEFRSKMGREELVLRFFAFKNNISEYVHDIDPFLTRYMERVTDDRSPAHIRFDYVSEEALFAHTFAVLKATLGSRASQRATEGGYTGGFTMSHYEAFSIGLASAINSARCDVTDAEQMMRIKDAMEAVKADPDFRRLTVGGGRNFRALYIQKIEKVRDAVLSAL